MPLFRAPVGGPLVADRGPGGAGAVFSDSVSSCFLQPIRAHTVKARMAASKTLRITLPQTAFDPQKCASLPEEALTSLIYVI